MFSSPTVDLDVLKKRAFNLRWATVPNGVIPLTAADPDFPCAPEIADAMIRFTKSSTIYRKKQRWICRNISFFLKESGHTFFEL